MADPRRSFVSCLVSGSLDLDGLDPFPELPIGRVQQLEALFERVHGPRDGDGIELLRAWGVLFGPDEWQPVQLARLMRELGARDVSAALCAIVHVALGLRLVDRFGSEPQLRAVREHPGGAVLAFALTEASPGSDLSQIQTLARPNRTGFVLSGTKHWVTNALAATHFVVFARTAAAHASEKPRMTAFLVERGEGVTVEPVQSSVLPGALVGRVTFDDVALTEQDVLGPMAKGMRIVMSGLAEARLLVGAAVLGACIRSFDETLARLNQRRAFGRAVGHFPSVQDRIASMLADLLAVESLVFGVAGRNERLGLVDPVDNAVARLVASRASARLVDAARELHGAAAFAGDVNAAHRWGDIRALTLLDGSDLALESYIALEGTRPLRHRLEARRGDPLERLDALRSRAVEFAGSRFRRLLTDKPPGAELELLAELVERLGRTVREQLESHGGDIVEMQHVQRRLASILADLSTWTTLAFRLESEVTRRGEIGSRRMSDVAEIWTASAEGRILRQFERLEANDDQLRDGIAGRAYADQGYPFDVM